jgi:hypothetical protein
MPASLQKLSDNRKINPNHERPIQCPYCPQRYLLVWDDEEWNSVKDGFEWRRLSCVEVIEYTAILNSLRRSRFCRSREFRAGAGWTRIAAETGSGSELYIASP